MYLFVYTPNEQTITPFLTYSYAKTKAMMESLQHSYH